MILINNISLSTNQFLEETIKFFSLKKGERLISLTCSEKMIYFKENLFICRFLYDCINKGIKFHQEFLEINKESIARKVCDKDISKIITDFEGLRENKDLIIILAYDFFLNWLNDLIFDILRENTELLKNIKNIKYQGYELIDRIEKDPELIIEDIINILLYGNKEEENIRTKPEFWFKVFDDNIKIELTNEEKSFWESIHIWRNAYSHLIIRKKWEDLRDKLSSTDFILWIYSLFYLAYKVDNKISEKYNLETYDLEFNFSGQPLYNLKKISI